MTSSISMSFRLGNATRINLRRFATVGTVGAADDTDDGGIAASHSMKYYTRTEFHGY